jgi:hypothetical protein
MIRELKQTNKEDLFKPMIKEKPSVLDKIMQVIGYGKKR